jgi:hypothetical protein
VIRSVFCSLSILSLSVLAFVHSAEAGQMSLGVEGFYDNYKEPDPGVSVDTDAMYGSLTAGYAWGHDTIAAVDARGSYGEADYSSVSGTSENDPQFELEARARIGARESFMDGAVMPYIGIGGRAYYDHSEGTVTTLGYIGYDRKITQLYIPIGLDMSFPSGPWTIKPTLEYDQLIYGRVESDLGSIPGYSNITNEQHKGYGLRASVMFAHQWGRRIWEIGPFVRYWDIPESDVTADAANRFWVEPDNQRLQAGLTLKVLFQ